MKDSIVRVCLPRQISTSLLFILLMLVGLTGCALLSNPREGPSGRIIIWHSWSDNEAALLTRIVRQFEEVNPSLDIIIVSWPEEELLNRYRTAASEGLGPDLMIGSSEWIQELVEGGDIRQLSDTELRSTY